MTTGRIDHAPDYKSEKPDLERLRAAITTFNRSVADQASRERERARLRDAVVEAAKKWRQSDPESQRHLANYIRLATAVDGLIEFEATQEKKG